MSLIAWWKPPPSSGWRGERAPGRAQRKGRGARCSSPCNGPWGVRDARNNERQVCGRRRDGEAAGWSEHGWAARRQDPRRFFPILAFPVHAAYVLCQDED